MGEMGRGASSMPCALGGCLATVTVRLTAGSLSPSEVSRPVSQSVSRRGSQAAAESVCGEREDLEN